MITVTQIRNGERYFSRHLSANDYYSEGETVVGHWLGRGAERLGLRGQVDPEQFEALRCNRHPGTGERLTPRKPKVAFHDIVISAPKALSIAAMVGGDDRLLIAFRESAERTFREMEKLAAVRDRIGANVSGEAVRVTGNATVALFIHDTSRLLDPQVHAHGVFANVSYDASSGRYLALQPRQMMEATKESLRKDFFKDLATRTEKLGYEIVWRDDGFGIAGISMEMERLFSRRAQQRLEFEERYAALFGAAPTKQRIEQFIKEGKSAATARFKKEFTDRFARVPSGEEVRNFVKDFRSAHMKNSSRAEVRALHQSMLQKTNRSILNGVIQEARNRQYIRGETVAVTEEKGREPERVAVQPVEKQKSRERASRVGNRVAVGETAEQIIKKRKASKVALGRSEAIRRLRRGNDLSTALKGYPMALIAKQVRQQARRARYGR